MLLTTSSPVEITGREVKMSKVDMEMVSWTGRRVPSQRQVAVLGMDTELRLEGILLNPRTKGLCASACGVISQTTIRALPGKSSDDRLTGPSRANRGAHTASSQFHRRDSWEEVGVKENDALQNHCTCCAGARNAWRDPSDEQTPPTFYSAEPITTPLWSITASRDLRGAQGQASLRSSTTCKAVYHTREILSRRNREVLACGTFQSGCLTR